MSKVRFREDMSTNPLWGERRVHAQTDGDAKVVATEFGKNQQARREEFDDLAEFGAGRTCGEQDKLDGERSRAGGSANFKLVRVYYSCTCLTPIGH